jgi:hypothetical protein
LKRHGARSAIAENHRWQASSRPRGGTIKNGRRSANEG